MSSLIQSFPFLASRDLFARAPELPGRSTLGSLPEESSSSVESVPAYERVSKDFRSPEGVPISSDLRRERWPSRANVVPETGLEI